MRKWMDEGGKKTEWGFPGPMRGHGQKKMTQYKGEGKQLHTNLNSGSQ